MSKPRPQKCYHTYWHPYTGRPIAPKSLAFFLTTVCNLHCPECSVNIPGIAQPEHYDLDYIQAAAQMFYGIEHLIITGGEPTCHPLFQTIVPHLKTWFGCQVLTLITNGCRLIESADVLTHFDDILLSHYGHNQREADFLSSHFRDSRQYGPTIHLTTARRARHPAPCSRAYFLKYLYGRLYPCCAPAGFEATGIPVTEHWRKEILRVPLPCQECCFAEEHAEFEKSEQVGAPEAFTHTTSSFLRPMSCWPSPRDDIGIYGLELDSWMGRKVEIRLRPPRNKQCLNIVFESHAPRNQHPLRLTFENATTANILTRLVKQPGTEEIFVPMRQIKSASDEIWLTMRCAPIFIPHQLDTNNPDRRELGIRIVFLRYA